MIEKFSSKHLQQVFDVSNLCFEKGWTYQMFQEELEKDNRLDCVYVVDNKVVGYCFAMLGLDTLEILDVAVLKEYRNIGIATKLISHIEKLAKNKNSDIIFLLEVSEKNTNAQNLYKKLGYKTIHTRKNYYGENNSAFIMEKK